jgi:hypothetical protein
LKGFKTMKMKNLVSFFAAASMVFSMSAFSVNAAVEKGITLEYVASEVATERVVKIYYAGSDLANGVQGGEFYLNVEGADVENATLTLPTPTKSKFDNPDAPMIEDGSIFFCLFSADGDGVTTADNELITITLTVPESTGEFTVSVDTVQSYMFDATGEIMVECDEESLTIPGATVEEPKTPYAPTDLTAKRFDAHKDDVPVDAWSTTIDYDTTEVNGTLKWAISNGTNIAKVDTTVVSGEGSVVYGLFIAGQAAELDTITSVQLIAE